MPADVRAALGPAELEAIARGLGGRRCGSGWIARCPAHEDREPSLSLALGREGRLLARCHAGCDFAAILAALVQRGLLTDRWHGAPARRPSPARRPRKPRGSPGRAGSGLGPSRSGLALPPTVREGVDRDGPTLVAALARWPSRAVAAVQITRLSAAGCKRSGADPVRLTFGAAAGAACRVRRWSPGRPVALVEGLEDALAAALADPAAVPWAILGATGAARVILPESAAAILVLDADDAGRRAAAEAARVLAVPGRAVRIARLPDGLDPAALLEAGRAEELASHLRAIAAG